MKKNFAVSIVLGCAAFLAMTATSLANLKAERPDRRAPMMRLFEGGAVLSPLAHVRFCMIQPRECSRGTEDMAGPVELNDFAMADLARVNARVNRQIRPQAKNLNDFANAHWSLSPAAGDCNDYAVTKRRALIDLGWPVSSVLLAAVRTPWGEAHLVVVVRTNMGDLVLDNLHQNVMPVSSLRYTWLTIQSAADPRFWRTAAKRPV